MQYSKTVFLMIFSLGLLGGGLRAETDDKEQDSRYDRVYRELNLSEEQKAKMSDLRTEFEKESKGLKESIRTKRNELKEAKKKSASDAELKKKFNEIQDLQRKRASLKFDHHLKVQKILNEEQKKKFGELSEKREERREHRMEKMKKKEMRMEKRRDGDKERE